MYYEAQKVIYLVWFHFYILFTRIVSGSSQFDSHILLLVNGIQIDCFCIQDFTLQQ